MNIPEEIVMEISSQIEDYSHYMNFTTAFYTFYKKKKNIFDKVWFKKNKKEDIYPLVRRKYIIIGGKKINHGKYELYDRHSSMRVESSRYRLGELDGIHMEWWLNGNLFHICTHKNGKKEGLEQHFFDNGVKSQEVNYIQDKKHGKEKLWKPSGEFYLERIYENGEIIS